MSNRELLSCSIDELKDKITRFYFTIGGFFSGQDSVEIVKGVTQIKYICNREENTFTKEKLNEFINKIFIENILKWKKRYNNILDGTQWRLEMKYKDLPKFESCGSNEYPDNWKNFIIIINEYFPQMELNYFLEIDI